MPLSYEGKYTWADMIKSNPEFALPEPKKTLCELCGKEWVYGKFCEECQEYLKMG